MEYNGKDCPRCSVKGTMSIIVREGNREVHKCSICKLDIVVIDLMSGGKENGRNEC